MLVLMQTFYMHSTWYYASVGIAVAVSVFVASHSSIQMAWQTELVFGMEASFSQSYSVL